MFQYDKQGNLLQSFTVPGLASTLGAEFRVPEPGALALLTLGGLLVCRRRRA